MMAPPSALASAIELARSGYWVFPVGVDKRPTCKWGSVATDDERSVLELWGGCPGPLVGVATGIQSRITVLDIDKKHPEAWSWWAENRPRLPVTRAHRTRSGGLHLIYLCNSSKLKNSSSKIAKGVDVRANGGYVVWWPAAGFPVLCEEPIAPWPEGLVPQEAPIPFRPQFTPVFGEKWDNRNRIVGLTQFVLRAPEGSRNARLHWAGCRIADMVRNAEIDRQTCSKAIEALSLAARGVGLRDREITTTLRSAARAA